jgi:hypothetical protein
MAKIIVDNPNVADPESENVSVSRYPEWPERRSQNPSFYSLTQDLAEAMLHDRSAQMIRGKDTAIAIGLSWGMIDLDLKDSSP